MSATFIMSIAVSMVWKSRFLPIETISYVYAQKEESNSGREERLTTVLCRRVERPRQGRGGGGAPGS